LLLPYPLLADSPAAFPPPRYSPIHSQPPQRQPAPGVSPPLLLHGAAS
jgi:hypothetical protein